MAGRDAARDARSAGLLSAHRDSRAIAPRRRGSRIALYDLRETVECATEPIALEFLAALNTLGDPSCLEGLAKAYGATADRWWRGHLLQTFRTIVGRDAQRTSLRQPIGARFQHQSLRHGNCA